MERKRLEEYRSNKEEIRELQYKLDHLGDGDSMIGNSVIFDYRQGYPKPQAVIGKDEEREKKLREIYIKQKARLEAECLEVEIFVEEIKDGITRRIIRMYYMDGVSQQKIARVMHVDQSVISRKIKNFFEVA